MKTLLRLSALAVPLLLNSCFSVCWLSLNLADTYLHKDSTVVVCEAVHPRLKYEYKGKDWYPVTLAYATDKGKGIIRKGDGAGYCLQDTSRRFVVQKDSKRTYLYSGPDWKNPDAPREMSPAEEFNFAAARKDETTGNPPVFRLEAPYFEFRHAAPGMPQPQPAPAPELWQEVVATPLYLLDITGSIAMNVTGIVVAPVIRIGRGIAGLFCTDDEDAEE